MAPASSLLSGLPASLLQSLAIREGERVPRKNVSPELGKIAAAAIFSS
jgi:hypothetical protein